MIGKWCGAAVARGSGGSFGGGAAERGWADAAVDLGDAFRNGRASCGHDGAAGAVQFRDRRCGWDEKPHIGAGLWE